MADVAPMRIHQHQQQHHHQPTSIVRLKDDNFIEAAGLDRSGRSGRKSSMERLLEQSLNTGDNSYEVQQPMSNNDSHHVISNGLSNDAVGVRVSPQRPENLKSDQFIQDAGLNRTGRVARKSSMERLLEDQLNTREEQTSLPVKEEEQQYTIRAVSPKMQAGNSERKTSTSSSGDENATKTANGNNGKRKSSIYEQKQIEAPVATKGNRITARTEHLFKQYERDNAVHEAKPLANVNAEDSNAAVSEDAVAMTNGEKSKVDIAREEKQRELAEMKRLYQQRLEEEERAEAKERMKQREHRRKSEDILQITEDQLVANKPPVADDDAKSDCSDRKMSTSSSGDENAPKIAKQGGRKNSIYEQKQIEAPVATKGNRITSRTENLFKQYERDVAATPSEEGKSKVDIAREEKQRELTEMKKLYQQRLEEEELVQQEEKIQQRHNSEMKCRKHLGDVKNRYLQIAQGEGAQQNSEEEENGELVDQKGDKIEKSGGKIEIVKSSDGVGSIRDRFGSIGKGGWKKQNQDGLDTDQVDANAVSSARNLFKNFEQQKQDDQKSFVRPTARKVRDPKELMEERKKATYGGEDELPEDGVVKKSVIIDEEELASGSSSRKEALNVYKELQSSPKDNGVNSKQETNKRSDSMSGSENDGDEVSGYGGSDSPCSPTSTTSEDYVSDGQKENEKGELDDDFIENEEEVDA